MTIGGLIARSNVLSVDASSSLGAIAVPDINLAIEAAEQWVNEKPDNPSWDQEENRAFKVGLTQSRQSRLAIVIGDMGDSRSTAVLERLLAELREKDDRLYTIGYVESALKKIGEKNGVRLEKVTFALLEMSIFQA